MWTIRTTDNRPGVEEILTRWAPAWRSGLDRLGRANRTQRWFTMTTITPKMVERIPLEVINHSNFELLNELVASDFVDHSAQFGVAPTREGFKESLLALKTAFPDLTYTIDDAIDGGDRIVHRVTARGTMKGDFMGIQATNRQATWNEIHIAQVVNGRLTEHWGIVDMLGMLVQLGVVEAPGRSPVAV